MMVKRPVVPLVPLRRAGCPVVGAIGDIVRRRGAIVKEHDDLACAATACRASLIILLVPVVLAPAPPPAPPPPPLPLLLEPCRLLLRCAVAEPRRL